ncbi:hypothetical protein IWW37_003429 [Coemansia sp. RSA 2050]|nr:hypothetical protein IWW37_003429 [Coemansia sp. RSA 2050]KAJ2732908.1 hypothetical protein IW152_003491 [Coemansia sp. BCRC 34962]
MLFPVPRTGSERWRAYLQQRREYGDAQTGRPDAMCEAERLFEIAPGSYDMRVLSELDSERDDYKTLQQLQNRDWAQRIALSVSEESGMHDLDDVLEKLNHALELDPDCITALYHRARL